MKKWLIIVFACVLSIGFFSGRYSLRKERALNVANLRAARDTIQTYSVKIKSLETFVSLKNAIIEDQKDAIEAGLIEKERLKALHLKELITNTQLQATIKILRDSLKLPPEIQFVTIKDTSGNYLAVRVPYQWKYSDQYVSLTTGIRLNKTGFFELSVPFSGEMSIGYQRSGFLKVKPVGILTTTNPYLKVEKMDVLIVKDSKKWHQKTWIHILAGAVTIEAIHQFIK